MELYVSIEELKDQLNLAREYECEDAHLLSLLETAQVSVETSIQRPLTDRVVEGRLNPMLKHAIKLLAANLYANRDPVAYGQPHPIPYTFEYLLTPHRKLT